MNTMGPMGSDIPPLPSSLLTPTHPAPGGSAAYDPMTWCRESQQASALMAHLCDLDEACRKHPPGALCLPQAGARGDLAAHEMPRPPKPKPKTFSPRAQRIQLGSQHPKRGWTAHPSTPHKHHRLPFRPPEPAKGIWDFSCPL